MAVVNIFIPGLSPENPHYIPGYTGHCPLLQFSVGQTYGQVTGFIPQAQFIFAKNCNQVWAEAMSDFTQRCRERESHELSGGTKGEKEVEKDQGPEAEEPQLKQKSAHVSPYSMDDTDPQKFFMSGERTWVVKGMGRPQDVLTQHLPHPQASRATCPVLPSSGFMGYAPRARFLRLHRLRAPCSLPLWRQLPCAHQPGAAGIWADVLTGQGTEGPQTSSHGFPAPTFRIWIFCFTREATWQVRRAPERLRGLWCVCRWGSWGNWNRQAQRDVSPILGFSFREET
ncbi:protein FAM166B [Mastomys coucha]|uniref:protein FAM166B n=1 Tax=Mastomys coucha TaxID=35658 RepID=UPI0012614D99|nr:protein FAM166B [Mastomys coucha]